MSFARFRHIGLTAALVLLPTAALAHPGHLEASGLAHGFTHPVTGLDHILAMVMVGMFAWQLASHKVCRWLVPFGMIGAAISNWFLIGDSMFYAAAFVLQGAFYLAALGGVWTGAPALRIPMFFLIANLGVLTAWLRYARGERLSTWSPSQRVSALPSLTAVDSIDPRVKGLTS